MDWTLNVSSGKRELDEKELKGMCDKCGYEIFRLER
jgi:hypothetical protein